MNFLNLDEAPVASQSQHADIISMTSTPLSSQVLMPKIKSVLKYVQASNYEGYDLFDGLNSQLFKSTWFYRNRWFRLALIQFCKKSSVDFRPVLGVPKGFNSKGGALFLLGLISLFKATGEEAYSNEAYLLFQRLRRTMLSRRVGNAWGYNFDWQARAFFVPQNTPNLVTSVYVGRALIAYYQCFQDAQALILALGISDYILNEMILFEDDYLACFRYIPGESTEVHNANLLGASFLAEVFQYLPLNRQYRMRSLIQKATRFSIADINPDGSWPYGTQSFHRWVDNFHTAFNIECLYKIQKCLEIDDYAIALDQVIDYYLNNLFSPEGLPRYYNNSLYPVDVHVLANAIILMNLLRSMDYQGHSGRRLLIENALLNLVEEFQDSRGFFYYQKLLHGWNRISYIRWAQAWMFCAMTDCL